MGKRTTLTRMTSDDKLRELLALVSATPGWNLSFTGNGFARVEAPDGESIQVHLTPSGNATYQNLRARFKRMGWSPTSAHADKERQREVRMQLVREQEALALEEAQKRIDAERAAHVDETPVAHTPPGPPDDFDAEYGLRWRFAPDGPPPSKAQRPAEVVVSEAPSAPLPLATEGWEPPPLPVAATNGAGTHESAGARSAAKLRNTTFERLVEEAPPSPRRSAAEQTRQHSERLLLEVVTQSPGKWLKLPDQTTQNAATYLRDAAKALDVKLATRFVKDEADETVGWLYLKAEEQ